MFYDKFMHEKYISHCEGEEGLQVNGAKLGH